MGISGIKGIDSTSGGPMSKAQSADPAIKSIRDEISEIQRQRQELSAEKDLPSAEKAKKQQELQQKISGLNRELRQRQAQVRKEQQKEILAKESRTDAPSAGQTNEKAVKPKGLAQNASVEGTLQKDGLHSEDVSTEKTDRKTTSQEKVQQEATPQKQAMRDKASQLQDFDIPQKQWKAVMQSDSAREQARKQGTVIARIEGGIAILKSEIKLDEIRGADVEKKQDELKKQTEKLRDASAGRFTSPDQFNQAAEKTVPAKQDNTENLSQLNSQPAQPQLFKDIAVSLTI